MDKKWEEMTPEEKREERFKKWLELPDINFTSPEAEEAYRVRMKRLADVYQLKEPDRVPVQLPFGDLPLKWAGLTLRTAMYDYDLIRQVWKKFLQDFEMDTYSGPGMVLPGRVYDLIDYRLYKWPGRGLPEDAPAFQFAEGEYMRADEYDALMRNPSDFWMRVYMPRIFGVFESFRNLLPFTNIIELPASYFMPYSREDVQASLQTLIDVGDEIRKWMEVVAECTREAQEAGVPAPRGGGMAKAPFDTLGDTLRGTQGIMMDMYRQPDKLHEAMDLVADLTIESAINSVNASNSIMVGFPLHKGADGFMSAEQFETFYWPSLKKVILALNNEGIMASLFAEGSYMTRLEAVNDFDRGWILWRFDQTDMATAKKVLGGNCCIAGNVPSSLISTGKPQDIKEYCRKLIEVCGRGGGYILSAGSSVDSAPPENIRVMMEAAKEYGVYK
ncbi:uroporphyrinogen decarboxylase family protein [Chloroflexota bacterium]